MQSDELRGAMQKSGVVGNADVQFVRGCDERAPNRGGLKFDFSFSLGNS